MGVTVDGFLRLKLIVVTCRKRMNAKSKVQLAPGLPLRTEPLAFIQATIDSKT